MNYGILFCSYLFFHINTLCIICLDDRFRLSYVCSSDYLYVVRNKITLNIKKSQVLKMFCDKYRQLDLSF